MNLSTQSKNEASMTLCIGRAAPEFDLLCTDPTRRTWNARLQDYSGRWLILIFYPRDFSFV